MPVFLFTYRFTQGMTPNLCNNLAIDKATVGLLTVKRKKSWNWKPQLSDSKTHTLSLTGMFAKKSLVSLVTESPPDDAINTQEVVVLMSSGHQGIGEWPEKAKAQPEAFLPSREAPWLKALGTWVGQSQLVKNSICYVATKSTLKHFSKTDYTNVTVYMWHGVWSPHAHTWWGIQKEHQETTRSPHIMTLWQLVHCALG